MIAVIADDFTGAAELAGIAIRHGLRVSLCVGEVATTDTDVLVVSTDSRSITKSEALAVTEKIVNELLPLQPSWLYKKTDSVLRGYVMDELLLQMQLCKQSQALLLPANPTLGRTIESQQYFINHIPVHEAGFATDPEFPRTSALLPDMLGVPSIPVLEVGDALNLSSVMVASAASMQDVQYWANAVPEGIALAGAGDYFTALLQRTFSVRKADTIVLQQPFLYVCGTAFPASVKWIQEVAKTQPESLVWLRFLQTENEECILHHDCVLELKAALQNYGKAIFAIDAKTLPVHYTPLQLRNAMAAVVCELMAEQPVAEMFIEGGSTATSILDALAMHQLVPLQEWERGAVRMKAPSCLVSVKPGSYQLPQQVKALFLSEKE